MRTKRGKSDGNQSEIVTALRGIGCSVQVLSSVGEGCPDLLVGYRGYNYLFEIKDPTQPKHRHELTEEQREFHAAWQGQVQKVFSVREIMAAMKGYL